MTKNLTFSLFLSGLLATAAVSVCVWAADSHHDPMCSDVAKACQKAGYHPMSKKNAGHNDGGKSLSDCMDKVVEGKKVSGVTLDPADPALGQCKAVFKAAAGKSH